MSFFRKILSPLKGIVKSVAPFAAAIPGPIGAIAGAAGAVLNRAKPPAVMAPVSAFAPPVLAGGAPAAVAVGRAAGRVVGRVIRSPAARRAAGGAVIAGSVLAPMVGGEGQPRTRRRKRRCVPMCKPRRKRACKPRRRARSCAPRRVSFTTRDGRRVSFSRR